jgi:hypothetical protein
VADEGVASAVRAKAACTLALTRLSFARPRSRTASSGRRPNWREKRLQQQQQQQQPHPVAMPERSREQAAEKGAPRSCEPSPSCLRCRPPRNRTRIQSRRPLLGEYPKRPSNIGTAPPRRHGRPAQHLLAVALADEVELGTPDDDRAPEPESGCVEGRTAVSMRCAVEAVRPGGRRRRRGRRPVLLRPPRLDRSQTTAQVSFSPYLRPKDLLLGQHDVSEGRDHQSRPLSSRLVVSPRLAGSTSNIRRPRNRRHGARGGAVIGRAADRADWKKTW